MVEGSNIGYMYDTGRRYELRDWLQHIRLNMRQHATFYFPESAVGPDILWAMQRPGNPQKGIRRNVVLCSLQVR